VSARDDDPLAGATIVVHDLSRPSALAAEAALGTPPSTPSAAGTHGAPATPGVLSQPPARPNAMGIAAFGIAVVFLGIFGYFIAQGRTPAAVSIGSLGSPAKVEIRVQVEGAVAQPGVYRLAQGDRVEDAIKAAGGLTANADSNRLNLAQRVRDEQRLDVPALAPPRDAPAPDAAAQPAVVAAQAPSQLSAPAAAPAARPTATTRPASTPRPEPTARPTAFSGGRVNVNTATQAQLEQLPGIGATSAQRILSYRATNGPLRSPDDLKKAGVQDQFIRQAADYLDFG